MFKSEIILLLSLLFFQSCYSQKSDDINSLIAAGKDIYIENQTFNNDIDFTNYSAQYNDDDITSRNTISSSIIFVKCVFKGKVLGYKQGQGQKNNCVIFEKNVTFENCSFNEDVNFASCNIYGKANFIVCMFNKTASFENCRFFGNASFSQSIFSDNTRFQNAVFNDRVSFQKAFFYKPVSFQGAYFDLDANFNVVKFLQDVDFSLINANNSIFFNYSEFKSKVTFNDSKLNNRFEFISTKLYDVDMENCKFYGATKFSDAAVSGRMNLTNSIFILYKPDTKGFSVDNIILNNVKYGSFDTWKAIDK